MKPILLLMLACILCGPLSSAQEYFPKNDGVKAENLNYTALINARIFITPTEVVNNGTLLFRKGKVVAVGNSVTLPKNTIVIDATGRSIYPSFIDIFSDFGVAKPKKANSSGRSAEFDSSREGFYWNDHIMPENDAVDEYTYNDAAAKTLREAGFGVVNSHIQDGIARGTGVLTSLNAKGGNANRILAQQSAQYFSFKKSIAKKQSYPTSLMGAMALLRQLYNDAAWYERAAVDTKDLSLEAFNANKNLVQIFTAGDKGNVVRADGIGDAFNVQYAILGGGDEYERVADIKATKASLILPLNFPDAYDVSDPYASGYVALKDMRHWYQSPANPKILAENNIPISFTLYGLKSPSDLNTKIMKAIDYGLSKEKALEALTLAPAAILGKSEEIGSLKKGSYANFLVTSGDLFEKDTQLYENWVQGQKNVVNDMSLTDISGDYSLNVSGDIYALSITGEPGSSKAKIEKDSLTLDSKFSYAHNWLTLSFSLKDTTNNSTDVYRLTGIINDSSDVLSGRVVMPNGDETTFKAVKTVASSKPKAEMKRAAKEKDKTQRVLTVTYPNVGYGYASIPKAEKIPL